MGAENRLNCQQVNRLMELFLYSNRCYPCISIRENGRWKHNGSFAAPCCILAKKCFSLGEVTAALASQQQKSGPEGGTIWKLLLGAPYSFFFFPFSASGCLPIIHEHPFWGKKLAYRYIHANNTEYIITLNTMLVQVKCLLYLTHICLYIHPYICPRIQSISPLLPLFLTRARMDGSALRLLRLRLRSELRARSVFQSRVESVSVSPARLSSTVGRVPRNPKVLLSAPSSSHA